MRRYALQDMVRVRQHREEQASEAVARARRALLEAEKALVAAQTKLEEYAVWRVQEEKRRLDALMRRMLKLGELSDVRQEIAALREHEFTLMDEVKRAEAAVTEARVRLDEARVRHAQAVRDLEKLLEHRTLWQREVAREDELAEDLELEEFSRPKISEFEESHYERN
ncbi:MAG: YscO family type III secretion system apparatus protein [Opitutaceae bacterium]